MRSPKTVYEWLQKDILSDFGYRSFRDSRGRYRIQVRREDLAALEK